LGRCFSPYKYITAHPHISGKTHTYFSPINVSTDSKQLDSGKQIKSGKKYIHHLAPDHHIQHISPDHHIQHTPDHHISPEIATLYIHQLAQATSKVQDYIYQNITIKRQVRQYRHQFGSCRIEFHQNSVYQIRDLPKWHSNIWQKLTSTPHMLQGAQQLLICLPENKLNVIRYLTVVLKCKVIKKKYSEQKKYRSEVTEQNKKCYRVNKNYCQPH
jgi:hypothetical protein